MCASAAVTRRLAGVHNWILACHVSYLRGRRHPKSGAPRLVRMYVVTDPDATGVLAEVLGSVYVLIRMPSRAKVAEAAAGDVERNDAELRAARQQGHEQRTEAGQRSRKQHKDAKRQQKKAEARAAAGTARGGED